MDDALLVSRVIGGDLDSFGQLYDRYFNRIYDFCWRITRDADEAADATQDVFMKAAMQGLPGLAKASTFKSWIFTMAHNTAVTRAERAARTSPLPVPSHDEAFGTFDVPDPSRLDNPALAAEDHELAALVWEAASALNPRDYALLDLHVRQGLESAEIAQVLEVSKGNASTMVSRMKTAAGDVISSYVVARRGSKDCDELRHVLAAYTLPPFSNDVRRAVDAHVESCETCRRSRRSLVAPLQIFGSFAAVPAPFALKGDTWRDISSSWPQADGDSGNLALGPSLSEWRGEEVATDGGADGGSGGPGLATEDGDSGNRIVLFAVAALGLLVFAFAIAGGVILAGNAGGADDGGDTGSGGLGGPTRTAIARTPSTPGVVVETPTIDVNASATPTPEPDTPTPTPEPPTPAPPTATPTLEPDTPTPTRTPLGFRPPTPTPTPTPEAAVTPANATPANTP